MLTRHLFFAQIITCPLEAYQQNRKLMDLTIEHAVAACIKGVAADEVTNIQMTFAASQGQAQAHVLRGVAEHEGGGGSSALSYVVSTDDPRLSFDVLKTELKAACDNGALAEALHHYAAVYEVPVLGNATVSSTTVSGPQPLSPNDHHPGDFHKFTSNTISTVVVLVGAVLFIVILRVVVLKTGCCDPQADPDDIDIAARRAVEDPHSRVGQLHH